MKLHSFTFPRLAKSPKLAKPPKLQNLRKFVPALNYAKFSFMNCMVYTMSRMFSYMKER